MIIFTILGGQLKYFLFSLLFREVSDFDEHIFYMAWFNHQLAFVLLELRKKKKKHLFVFFFRTAIHVEVVGLLKKTCQSGEIF